MSHDDHGSSSTYQNYDCRCDACKAAWTADCLRRREERKAALAGDARPDRGSGVRAHTQPREHGTDSTYTNWMCRCEPCTKAHTADESKRRKARLARRPGVTNG